MLGLRLLRKPPQVDKTLPPDIQFWDKFAPRYASMKVADEASYQRKLEVTREYFRPDMEVLEFGCGTGSTAIAQAPYVKHIRAIDISEKMLEIARERAEEAEVENITFEQGSIEDLHAPEASFDAVMGHSILHLVADRHAVIAKVHDLLKPGGVFITSTICLGEKMSLFRIFGRIGYALGLIPRLTVFTVPELADSLTDASFTIDHQWQPAQGKAVFLVAEKE